MEIKTDISYLKTNTIFFTEAKLNAAVEWINVAAQSGKRRWEGGGGEGREMYSLRSKFQRKC